MGNGGSAFDWQPVLQSMCSEYEDVSDKIAPKEIDRAAIKSAPKGSLGKGRFGVVKKCMLSLGATKEERKASVPIAVVCKQVKKAHAAAVMQGAAELAQFGDMTPENVLRIVGMVTKGGPTLLVVEFCDHGSLDAFLTQRIGMSTADKLSVMAAVADGMSELEAKGFVHGSLSTRNVLVAEGGKLFKVSDWGIRSTSFRELAPELLKVDDPAAREFTHKSDVWSYGMLAYEIFDDAKPAFSPAWDDFVVKQKVIDGFRPKHRDGCPAVTYELITKCWDVEAAKRPDFYWLRAEIEDKRDAAIDNERRSSDPTLLESS